MFSVLTSKYLFETYQEWNMSPDMLLDPITTATRLALLQHKPQGTKISIQHHKITYLEPSIMQGTWRMFQGDQREDLKNLYTPIVAICRFWSDYPGIKEIVGEAVMGIQHLRKTYSETSTIYHTLTLYKSMLEHFLDGRGIDNLVQSATDLNDPPAEDIKELWKRKEVEVMAVLLKNVIYYQGNEELTRLHINPIEKMLETKEEILRQILEKRIGTL
jgi:hypothetical protein